MANWFKSIFGKSDKIDTKPAEEAKIDYKLVLPDTPKDIQAEPDFHTVLTEYYRVVLTNDWTKVPDSEINDLDVEVFDHKTKPVECTISLLRMKSTDEYLRLMAEKILEFRVDSHSELCKNMGRTAYFHVPQVSENSWGYQATYAVGDKETFCALYSGFIANEFTLNIYLQAENTDLEDLRIEHLRVMEAITFTEKLWGQRPIPHGFMIQ